MSNENYRLVQGHVIWQTRRICIVCEAQEAEDGSMPVCRYEPTLTGASGSRDLLGPDYDHGPWPTTLSGKDVRPSSILCDVDGTVARNTGRGPFDWNRVGEDHPERDVMDLVDCYRNATGLPLIILSGRSDACRDLTLSWLRMFLSFDSLLMREDGDYTPDWALKLQIYRMRIEPYTKIKAVFDDRKQVVDMWRSIGLRCYDVAGHTF